MIQFSGIPLLMTYAILCNVYSRKRILENWWTLKFFSENMKGCVLLRCLIKAVAKIACKCRRTVFEASATVAMYFKRRGRLGRVESVTTGVGIRLKEKGGWGGREGGREGERERGGEQQIKRLPAIIVLLGKRSL